MKILCATDFSEQGQAAEAETVTLARALGAEVVYLHVSAEPMLYGESPFSIRNLKDVYDAQQRWVEDALKARVAAIQAMGTTARWVLRAGVPYEQIVAAAEEEKADMLVLGTHGRSGLNRLLLGSVAERVVRLAPCPVLTVRPHRSP
jgi:nucleotide-binding universal stress UspA family protein